MSNFCSVENAFLSHTQKRQTLGQCYRKGSFTTSDNPSVCIKCNFMRFLCSDLHIKANILSFVGFCLLFYALACAIYLYKPWWYGSGASVIFCITFVINKDKILFDGFSGVLAVLFASVNRRFKDLAQCHMWNNGVGVGGGTDRDGHFIRWLGSSTPVFSSTV